MSDQIEMAFNLLYQGKISRKKAWKLSGLNYKEFLSEWSKRGFQENISEEAWDKDMNYLKSKNKDLFYFSTNFTD
jgi:predicted HTH domain antitoxin